MENYKNAQHLTIKDAHISSIEERRALLEKAKTEMASDQSESD